MPKQTPKPLTPNAILPAQVGRLLGVAPQTVDKELKREGSFLEAFDFAGSRMVTMASVRRWQAARAKRAAAAVAKLEEVEL
jgi:IS30 family transposase